MDDCGKVPLVFLVVLDNVLDANDFDFGESLEDSGEDEDCVHVGFGEVGRGLGLVREEGEEPGDMGEVIWVNDGGVEGEGGELERGERGLEDGGDT